MAATLQTLIDRTRNYLRDTPDFDQLTVSISSSATSMLVADNSVYRARWPIEIDYETIMLRSTGGTVSLTGTRAWRGSTAASHAASAPILVKPSFYAAEIIDAINSAIGTMFPWVYKPVVDTSLTVLQNQYQYVIPDMPGYTGYPIPYIYNVEILHPGDLTFRKVRRWEVLRGFVTAASPSLSGSVASTYPIIKFRGLPPVGATLRVSGFGPMPRLTNLTDTLDGLFPPQCEMLLHRIAAGYLLQSGEAGRDRSDTGPTDSRESANRGGLSLQTAQGVLNRAEYELVRGAMPPMPRHVKAVI